MLSKAIRSVYFFLIMTALCNCNSTNKEKLFINLSKEQTGISFQNKLTYNDSLTVLDFEYMFNGAGVALIDVNNDGLTDVFFTGNMVSCRLYLNKGKLKFEDITEKAGLKTTGWCYGASVVDINQDGYQDIYVCKAGNRKTPADSMHNLFFINNGNNTFTDKAAQMGLDEAGYDIQAAFLDYDKDGDLDMYLLKNSFVNYNRNNVRIKKVDGMALSTDKLFRNNSTSPSSPLKGRGVPSPLSTPWRGAGGEAFTDVSKEAGITIEGFGLGVSVCDLNNDNWPDLYVSNDFLTNDLVWINNRNGTFTNKASIMLRHETYNGMGNDVADYNNDGLEDIVVVDMLPPDNKRWKQTMRGNTYDEFQYGLSYGYEPQYVRNTLQLNNGISPSHKGEGRGEVTFSEIGQLSGVNATEWSWAPLFADFDNDGFKDLFISNGYRQDITNLDFIVYGKRALFIGTAEGNRKERLDELKKFPGIQVPNYIFKNKGDLTFANKSTEWGFTDAAYSNGSAYGDLDNDGDLELVINNLDQDASVYENQSEKINPSSKWLRINFKGPEGNRNGLGAKVFTWQKNNMQYQYFSPYRGYLSTVEPYLHFGFQNKTVDSLKVIWPDGKQQLIKNPSLNKLLTLSYSDAGLPVKISKPNNDFIFTDCAKEVQIKYKHQEDEFVDFKLQPLLPHLLSHEGPGISVADVNADGLEDFFVGAATGYRGSIFTQNKNGTFSQYALADSNLADNMGALFFDADNDGDNDLYIVSGGLSDKKNGDPSYQHLLYLNDGKARLPAPARSGSGGRAGTDGNGEVGQGNFMQIKNALPQINTSGSSVIAADYDHDGDLDLFVGGRVSPGEYPYTLKSFLLRNDTPHPPKGGVKFTDVTKQAGIPSALGMVTSALFTDFDNDGWQDLIIAGEFMPITFIKNEKGKFSSPFIIEHSQGWWNSIVAGDFDKDGDIDYMAGNLGLNGPYKASANEPVCIYAKDYDKNGKLDPVMCHYQDGKEYIVHARDDISKQMNPMRARFRDYTSYATITFQEAFRADEISDAYVLRAETFASAYIENLGNGKFAGHSLPLTAQLAPVYGMVCKDFNEDGKADVLCVGNSYSTEVQTGRYDAQGSFLLMGDGKGHFSVNRKQINVPGDNKSVAELLSANGSSLFLISSNSDSLHTYRFTRPAKKIISINPDETYAIITGRDGIKYRREFYYGNTYLSQSTRSLTISANIQSVIVYNISGKKRELNF